MPGFETLAPRLCALAEERFGKATRIQELAFQKVLENKNVLIIAPTGTGKTEAAVLPVLSKLASQENPAKAISVVYISPLKSLNRDLLERIEWWASKLGLSLGVRHGDTPTSERTKQQKNPPQLLITTPETLGSLLVAPKMGKHLENVRFVIIDEVHELVCDKRGCQLTLALERLAVRAPGFQRIGLSATVGEPAKVADFFKLEEVVRDPATERKLELSVECPRWNKEDAALAAQLQTVPEVAARLRRIKQLVNENNAVLAFVNTRQMAELLASRFEAWDKAHHIGVHHSSLSRDVRVVAEKTFKEGGIKGLIATSSLELGVDIGRVELVVQYLSPRQVSRLIQRVGRSGHSVHAFPKGVVLCQDAEDVLEAGAIAKHALEGRLESTRTFEKPLDVLAQQLVGITLESGRQNIENSLALVRKAHPFRNLTETEFLSVLRQLASQRIIWFEDREFGKRKPAYLYYFTNLSMIPDESKFFVIDAASGKNIAVLDESFVTNNLGIGELFVCRGMPWRVLDVAEKEVIVETADDISGAIPAWEGEQIPVPFEIAQEVGKLRRLVARDGFDFSKYCFDGAAFAEALHLARKQEPFFVPDENKIFIETIDNFVLCHAHFGTLVNETLAKVVSVLVSSFLGASVRTKTTPYCIVFQFSEKHEPRPDLVKRFLLETRPDQLRGILEKSLLRTTLFRTRFVHVAKRFGLLEKRVDYQRVSVRRLIEAVCDSPVYEEALNEIFTEKLDVEKAAQVLGQIQNKEVGLVDCKGQSALSKFVLHKFMSLPELVMPGRPDDEIIEIMRKRILARRAKLFCTYCKAYFYETVENLPKKIKCPSCGAATMTFAKNDEDVKTLFEKQHLSAQEEKKKKEYEQVAVLLNAYGKNAVIVLSGRGVGPDAATRLLSRMRKSEKELFKDMLDAQKQFLATKQYWKQ